MKGANVEVNGTSSVTHSYCLVRVQELDTAVQSPSAQARMRQWKELPRDQLSLILGTLYEKTNMVEG